MGLEVYALVILSSLALFAVAVDAPPFSVQDIFTKWGGGGERGRGGRV